MSLIASVAARRRKWAVQSKAVRLLMAAALGSGIVMLGPGHAAAFPCRFPGECNEGDRVVAAAAQHRGQLYQHGGDGYVRSNVQDLREPADCRGLVGAVLHETGDGPLLSTVVAYQDYYRTAGNAESYDDFSLPGTSLAVIDQVIQDTLGPGDLIVFAPWGGTKIDDGTHIGIYDGQGSVWSAESSTSTKYSRNSPYDGSRPGAQLDPYTGFGTRDKNGNPTSGIFPTMVIRTGFQDQPPKSVDLPPAPRGYGVVWPASGQDFTGEGNADVLGYSSATGVMSVYPSSRFNVGPAIPLHNGPSLANMQVFSPGDWNGDTYPDLLALNDSQLLLYEGGPRGFENSTGFQAPIPIGLDLAIGGQPGDWSQIQSVFSPGHFTAGIGTPDLYAIGKDGRLWLISNADFANPRPIATDTPNWSSSSMKWVFSPGDWGKGNVADIIAVDPAGAMWLYQGPNFAASARTQIGSGWGTMEYVFSPGDFTGDGFPDVIARAHSDSRPLLLYRGNGRGFGSSSQIGTGWGTMTDIFSPGDMVGNAYPDILAVNNQGQLLLYPWSGTAFSAGTQVRLAIGPIDWTGLTAYFSPGDLDDGDANGDGLYARDVKADIIAIKSDTMYLYAGYGTTLTANPRQMGGSDWDLMRLVFSPGDFDQDGIPDIIAVTGQAGTKDGNTENEITFNAGDLLLFKGTLGPYGEYELSRGVNIGHGCQNLRWVFSGGDYTGDGFPDIVAVVGGDPGGPTYGQLLLYPNNSQGGVNSAVSIGTGWQNFDYVFSPGDFGRDGLADVLARDASGSLWLYVPAPKPADWSSTHLPIGATGAWAAVQLSN